MQTAILNEAKTAPVSLTAQPIKRSFVRRINRMMIWMFGRELAGLSTKSKLKAIYLASSFVSLSAFSEETIWFDILLVANFAIARYCSRNVLPKKENTWKKL